MATINEVCSIIAQSGDTTAPAVNPVGGNNSSTVFSTNYGFPKLMGTSLGAGGTPIPRDEMNGALGYITSFLNSITNGLQVSWLSTVTYSIDCVVFDATTKNYYRSLQNSNTNHALTDTTWWEVQQSPNPSVYNPNVNQYQVNVFASANNNYISNITSGVDNSNVPSWQGGTNFIKFYQSIGAGEVTGGVLIQGSYLQLGYDSNISTGASVMRFFNKQSDGVDPTRRFTTFDCNGFDAPDLTYGDLLNRKSSTIATLGNIGVEKLLGTIGGAACILIIQPLTYEGEYLCIITSQATVNRSTYNLTGIFTSAKYSAVTFNLVYDTTTVGNGGGGNASFVDIRQNTVSQIVTSGSTADPWVNISFVANLTLTLV